MSLINKSVGTAGLIIAIDLYGQKCVRHVGDWLDPAIVQIPEADEAAFDSLHMERIDQINGSVSAVIQSFLPGFSICRLAALC